MDAETRQYLEDFKKDLIERIKSLESHMQQILETKVGNLDREVLNLREQLKEDVYPRLNKVETKIGKLEDRIESNEKAIEGHVEDSKEKSQFNITQIVALLGVLAAFVIAIFF